MQDKKEIFIMHNWYETAKEKLERIARYEGAKQERSIWYHGTKGRHLSKILSEGLVAFPKERAWQEDRDASFYSPSRASLGGIYLTQNLMTARSSALRHKKQDEDMVMVIVEAQPRSFLMDEDDVSNLVKDITYNSEWLIAELYMAQKMNANQKYVRDTKDKYINDSISAIKHKFDIKELVVNKLYGVIENGFQTVLDRKAAYIDDRSWETAFYRNLSEDMSHNINMKWKELKQQYGEQKGDVKYGEYIKSLIPPRPDKQEAEIQFAHFVDTLTRILKSYVTPSHRPGDKFNPTARSENNIGFKGSNKIICIVTEDKGYNLKVVYGTMPQKFIDDYTRNVGEMARHLTTIPKAAMSNKWYKTASQAIWYHGTLIANYPKIASEGLLATPQKRLWDKDKGDAVAPSKASLPGVYLTQELIDAINAPGDALEATLGHTDYMKNVSPDVLLAIVQADTQSLYVDEDAMSFDVCSATEGVSDYLTSLIYISGINGVDQAYFNQAKERFVDRQMKILNDKFHIKHPELVKRLKEILDDGFINALTRQVAYAYPDEYQRAYFDVAAKQKRLQKHNKEIETAVGLPYRPSQAKGEEMFRQLMDQLTRTLKFYKHQQGTLDNRREYWESGRYPFNISFNGATKIIALLRIIIREAGKSLYPSEYRYKVLYGQPPQQFLNDWQDLVRRGEEIKDVETLSVNDYLIKKYKK